MGEQGRKGHFPQKELYMQDYKGMKEHGAFGMPQLNCSGQITQLPCLSVIICKMWIVMVSTELRMVRNK